MANKAAGTVGPYVAGDFNYVPPPPDAAGGTRLGFLGLGLTIVSGSPGAAPTKTLDTWLDTDNWVDSDPWVD